jgi:hypothetical protein
VTSELALRLAYGFNILVLAPVLFGLYRHQGAGEIAVIGGGVANSDGLRLLVASLWLAVLVLSAVALMTQPRAFVALLVFQVVYKAAYLATYVLPVLRSRGWEAVPMGPSAVFVFIVLVWPFIIAAVWRGGIG